MPRGRRAALLLAAASPARCLLAPHTISTRDTRRTLATTPDEISHAAHYNAYDYNADSQNANEDDWRSMATAAGAVAVRQLQMGRGRCTITRLIWLLLGA